MTTNANIQEATVVTDSQGNLPPAGWYPDPYGAPYERWWDGAQWTDHTNTPAAPEPVVAPPAPAEPVAPSYQATSEPAYQQPAYQAPAQTTEPAYQAPAQTTEPAYQSPAQTTEPAYQAPAQTTEPAYQAPEQPAEQAYKAPAAEPSAWNTPASASASSFDDIFSTGQAPQSAVPQTAQPEFTTPASYSPAEPQSYQPTQPYHPAQSSEPSYPSVQPAYGQGAAQQSFQTAPASNGADDFGSLITGGGAGAPSGSADPFDSWSNQDYEEPARNTPATVGLTFGVLSFLIPGVAGLVGIVTSALGLRRAALLQREEGVALGRGKSIAGIALSVIGSAASIAAVIFVLPGLINPVDPTGGDEPSDVVANLPKTDSGNIALEQGATGTITFAGTTDPSIEFVVTGITVNPTCTQDAEFVLSPENGEFVALTMEFTTSADYLTAMDSGAPLQVAMSDFIGIVPDGTTVLNSNAGLSCMLEEEQLPTEIPAGETVTGTVVLDVSASTASFSYSPPGVTGLDSANTRWEWAIPR